MFVIRNLGNLRVSYYNFEKFFSLFPSFVTRLKVSSDCLKVDIGES